MSRIEKWLTATKLRSLGFNSLYGPHGLKLGSRVTDGPAGTVHRGIEFFLNEEDLNWLIAHLGANDYWATKMKAVVDERDSLLIEAEDAPAVRKLAITNRLSDRLMEVLR